ncbi:MAG: hypothetical protein AB7N65_05900 [Vicinamibacterales bacterium]
MSRPRRGKTAAIVERDGACVIFGAKSTPRPDSARRDRTRVSPIRTEPYGRIYAVRRNRDGTTVAERRT